MRRLLAASLVILFVLPASAAKPKKKKRLAVWPDRVVRGETVVLRAPIEATDVDWAVLPDGTKLWLFEGDTVLVLETLGVAKKLSIAMATSNGEIDVILHEIQVGPDPEPEPEPDPDPDPDPDPNPDPDPSPEPVARLRVQCIWEKRDGPPLPTPVYAMFMSGAVKGWIDSGGHDLERVDIHATDNIGGRVVTPEPDSLPVVRLLDADTGRLLWEGLPESEDDFLTVLRTYSKGSSKNGQVKYAPIPDEVELKSVGPDDTHSLETRPTYQRRGLLRRRR